MNKKPYVWYKEEFGGVYYREFIGIPGEDHFWTKSNNGWYEVAAGCVCVADPTIRYESDLTYKHPRRFGIKGYKNYKGFDDPDFIIDQL